MAQLLITEYSAGGDIVMLTRDANGNVTGEVKGVPGFSGFRNPISLAENPANGNIYVAQLGGEQLTLLRPQVPAAPTALAASVGLNGVSLRWSESSSSDPTTGYDIYRGSSAAGPFTQIGSTSGVSTTTFVDTSAPVATASFYQVTATDAAGQQSGPASVSATRPAATPPPVTSLTATSSGTHVTVSWNAASGPNVLGYQVFRSNSPAGPFQQVNVGVQPATTFADTTAPAGSAAYYRVVTVNVYGGVSSPVTSPPVTVADLQPPAAPTGVTAISVVNGVMLAWAANSEPDLAGYNVYRSYRRHSHFTRVNVGLLSSPSFADTTVKARVKVFYLVTAVNTSGIESVSTPISSKFRPPRHRRKPA